MEAHGHFGGMFGSRRAGSSLANRRTPVLIAIVSAVLAGVLIYLFVSHYSKRTVTAPTNVTVFEARTYIPRGLPQTAVAAQDLLKAVQVPATQAAGAITDPSEIAGQVSSVGIEAGQKVTASDFTTGNITIASYLKGNERAVAFSLDAEHGLTAYVAQGDTVDVMGLSGGKAEMLAQNVTVIANTAGNVVLRVSDKTALQLASATGVSSLWLTLRPPSDAKDSVNVGTVEKP
jgi:Flp pilus assembly protein CpaB